jgi:multiple antibiotic resistance protein
VDSSKLFLALLALVNPLGAVPIFISLTHGMSREERRKTVFTAATSVAGDHSVRLAGSENH